MDGSARNPNIFRVLETMKLELESILDFDTSGFSDVELEAWTAAQKRFVYEGADIRQVYVTELEDYLFSCEWTDNSVVTEIVGYIQKGTPLNFIGPLVGLQNVAFRLRMKRMTDKLNALLFDGQPCPEGVVSLTDLGALKKALLQLRLVRDPIDINVEFSLRQLNWMEAHIASAGIDSFVVDKSNLDKYFQTVLFLALTSRTFTLNFLDDIDPEALGYALKDMQSNSVNSTKLLFSLLLRHLTSDSVACKEELMTVKREYQDFMRGRS